MSAFYGYLENETGVQMLERLGFRYEMDGKKVVRIADGHVMARCSNATNTNAWVAAECPDLNGGPFLAPYVEEPA